MPEIVDARPLSSSTLSGFLESLVLAFVRLGTQTLVRQEYTLIGLPSLLVNSQSWLKSSLSSIEAGTLIVQVGNSQGSSSPPRW